MGHDKYAHLDEMEKKMDEMGWQLIGHKAEMTMDYGETQETHK